MGFTKVLGRLARELQPALSWALACGLLAAAAQKPPIQQLHVPIIMHDGVHLAANVFLPPGHTRVPTVLVRTPYGKGSGITAHYAAFVERGYAVVVQDVRGRYESEGAFLPLTQESSDGDDTLNWIAKQSWS